MRVKMGGVVVLSEEIHSKAQVTLLIWVSVRVRGCAWG